MDEGDEVQDDTNITQHLQLLPKHTQLQLVIEGLEYWVQQLVTHDRTQFLVV